MLGVTDGLKFLYCFICCVFALLASSHQPGKTCVIEWIASEVEGRREYEVRVRTRADSSDAYSRRTWRTTEWRPDECNRRGLSSCGSREGCESYLYSSLTRCVESESW